MSYLVGDAVCDREFLNPSYSKDEATAFIEQLTNQAKDHRAIQHPYLKMLSKGDFPDPVGAIKDLCFQYLAYSTDFIKYLTAAISQLQERRHRELLLNNLLEESGQVSEDEAEELRNIGIEIEWVQGVSHPRLFMRFLDAIGMGESWRARNKFCDEAIIWREMFLLVCSSGGAAQAMGAMGLGTENIVKYVYRPILEAIGKFLNVSRRDRVFFDLHASLDDEHGKIMTDIAIEYAQFNRHRPAIIKGMLMALNLRTAFFDAMMVRANSREIMESLNRSL